MVATGARAKAARVIGASALLPGEPTEAVIRRLHVAVAIHLEDIAELSIDQQAADRKVCSVLHREQLFRVAALDELADRRLDALPVHLGLAIDRQRVVHVEADRLHLVEAKVSVAVDPTSCRRREHTPRGRFELRRLEPLLQAVAQLSAG